VIYQHQPLWQQVVTSNTLWVLQPEPSFVPVLRVFVDKLIRPPLNTRTSGGKQLRPSPLTSSDDG